MQSEQYILPLEHGAAVLPSLYCAEKALDTVIYFYFFFKTHNIENDTYDVDLNSSKLHSIMGLNHVNDAFYLFWRENRPPSSLLLSTLNPEERAISTALIWHI